MSEPRDPFSYAEETRVREIVREELALSVRRALRSIAYDDLDAIFGVAPPESRPRRSASHSGRSPAQIPPVLNEQAIPTTLADNKPE